MGSAYPLLLSPSSTLYYLAINPTKTSVNPKLFSRFRCSFSSRPRWGPNPDPFRGDRFGFGFKEEFGFRRGVREKGSNWWSDDEDDDDADEDDDDEFGFWGEPSAIDWFFKILGAFGWMIPAVIISALLGNTGSNSLMMALVLPLGQTALSLVMDKLWGGPSSRPDPRPRPKPRRRRNPSVGSAYGSKESKGRARAPRTGSRGMNGSYKSWEGAKSSSSSAKKGGESGSSKFGGWDELDELNNGGVPKEGQNRKAEGLGRENGTENVKLSMRRKGERPLFIRLLIAVFPFVGSWSRFLF